MIEKYNIFHRNSQSVNKIINRNNFTYRRILEILSENINTRNLTILDYGCGVGSISLYLSNQGHCVTGVDVSTTAINKANKTVINIGQKLGIKFITLDQWKKNDFKMKYDVILCLEVIEHVKDDLNLIRLLKGRLKDNGKLILSTPSLDSPLYRLGLTKNFDNKVGHLRRYVFSDLINLINDSGLSLDKFYLEEGIIRNSLFLIKPFSKLIRFIKGPIVSIVYKLDRLSIYLFGYSDIILITKKNENNIH